MSGISIEYRLMQQGFYIFERPEWGLGRLTEAVGAIIRGKKQQKGDAAGGTQGVYWEGLSAQATMTTSTATTHQLCSGIRMCIRLL